MTTMQILIVLCGLAAVLYGLITSRQILSLGREAEQFTGEDAAYKRDSIFLTVHTRNLGGIGMAN